MCILPQAHSLRQSGIWHLTGSLIPATSSTHVGHTSSTTAPPFPTESRESSQPGKMHKTHSCSDQSDLDCYIQILALSGFFFFQSHQHHKSANVFSRIIFNDFYSAIKNKWCVSACPSAHMQSSSTITNYRPD